MKMLKVISNQHPDANKYFETRELVRDCGMWYLHGKLMDLFNYDVCFALNLEQFPKYYKNTVNWTTIRNGVSKESNPEIIKTIHINGEIPVEVVGVSESCVGYFWIIDLEKCINIDKNNNVQDFEIWKQCGLICLKSDIEACEYAKSKMEEKALFF